MDNVFENRIKEYFNRSRNKCFALKNWLALNVKKFSFMDALKCVYDYSRGNFNTMDDVIAHLTDKKKVYGRTQVYSDSVNTKPDIVIGNDGKLTLVGYRSEEPLTLKGQKVDRNSKIFRKTDSQTNKNYQKTEDKLYDIGYRLRQIYPTESNSFLTFALQGVRKYAIQHKINPNKIVDALEKGRVKFDDNFNIIKNIIEGRTIVISESMMKELNESFEMTEWKFYSNIKQFLCDLLEDPVNASVPMILKEYGFGRYKLLSYLIRFGIVEKDETISDKDENGEPKTATMKVKYKVPKKNFERNLKKLYIRLFEKNLPEKKTKIEEDGEGATTCDASSGQFSQPVFPMQRRTIDNVELDETTTTSNVGDYQYTVPFIGDKETLSRKNGEGGSVSINKM